MKKILYILTVVLLIAGCGQAKPAFAEVQFKDLIDKIPALNQAIIYNITDSKIDYATTITLVSLLNDKIKLDIGYSPTTQVLGAVSFKLVEVKDYLNYPILKWLIIEPLIWAGYDRIENLIPQSQGQAEFSYGVGAKLVSLKF